MANTQVIANLRQDLRDHREEIQRLLGVIDDIATERNELRAALDAVRSALLHHHASRPGIREVDAIATAAPGEGEAQ